MNEMSGPGGTMLRWMGKVGAFLGLSLLWLLCCIPLLTIVPACVALYDSVVTCVRGDEDGPFRQFFATFRAELLRGVGLSAVWIVLTVVLAAGFRVVYVLGKENSLFSVYSILYAGTMLIPMAVFGWMIPLRARFQYKFAELHRKALSFVIVHLPTTLGILAVFAVAVVLLFVLPVLLMLLPCIMVTVQAWLIEKVLVQYETTELA